MTVYTVEITLPYQRSFLLQEPNTKDLVSLEKQLIEFIREDLQNLD